MSSSHTHTRAQASQAEADKAAALQSRREMSILFQNVLKEQQQQAQAQQQQQAQEAQAQAQAGGPKGARASEAGGEADVCSVIADEGTRARCRQMLAEILGPQGEGGQAGELLGSLCYRGGLQGGGGGASKVRWALWGGL